MFEELYYFFFQKVNIIVTSDHGMTLTPEVIELNTYIDPSLYDFWGGSPVLNIIPKPGNPNPQLQYNKNVGHPYHVT